MKKVVKSEIIVYIVVAVIISILFRTIFRIGPNIEIITAFSIGAGFFFKNKIWSFLIPLLSISISDLIIGNSNIYLFTWSAFLIIPLIGNLFSKIKFRNKNEFLNVILSGVSGSIMGVLVFFLWTNLGVVIVGSGYTKDLDGIMLSYYYGLPFLKNQLMSAVVFTPIVFSIVLIALNNNFLRIFANHLVKK